MARFFNTLLPLGALLFVGFTWLYYYTRLPILSIVCAGAIALALMIPLYLLTGKKNKKQRERMKKSDAEKLANYLACHGGEQQMKEYFTLRGYHIDEQGDCLILTKGEHSTLCALHFTYAALTADEVAHYARQGKKCNANKVVIMCNKSTAQAVATASQLYAVTIKEVGWVYSTLKEAQLLPDLTTTKRTPKVLFAYALQSARAPLFFTCSLGLAFTSLFTFFPLYPLCFALLMLIAGLYAKYNKRFNLSEE